VSGISERNGNKINRMALIGCGAWAIPPGKGVRNIDRVQNTAKLVSGQISGVCPQPFDSGQACQAVDL
jgi:hypothetical protein